MNEWTKSPWAFEPLVSQNTRIEVPTLRCARCEQEADGSFQLKGGNEAWCQYCVREALVRMTAELRK